MFEDRVTMIHGGGVAGASRTCKDETGGFLPAGGLGGEHAVVGQAQAAGGLLRVERRYEDESAGGHVVAYLLDVAVERRYPIRAARGGLGNSHDLITHAVLLSLSVFVNRSPRPLVKC